MARPFFGCACSSRASMRDEQRFYDKLELVALHLHGKGLVSTQDLELMDSRAVFGLLAVVLLQYAVREAASRSHRVVTMDEDQHDPTVPTIFDDVRDRFINVRDRVGNLRGLTAGEMEWLQARLIDPHAHSDPPSHFGRDRASGLSDVFKRVYGTAVEMSRLSAFSAYLELLAADFPMPGRCQPATLADHGQAGGPSPGPLGGRRGSAPAGPGPADRGPPGPAARGAQDHAPTRRLGRVAALRGVQRPPVRGRAGAAARGGRRHPQRLRGHAAHHGRDGGPRRGRAPAPGLGCEPRARDEEGVDSVWCVPAGLGTWRLRTPPATAVRPGRCTADASFLRHLALTWR